VRAAMRAVQQLTFLGESERSAQMLSTIERVAAPLEARHPEVSIWLAELRSFRGAADDDYCAYLDVSLEAARTYERAGDLRMMCIKLSNAASTLLDLGAYERAEGLLRTALSAADRIGIPLAGAVIRVNVAIARLRQGAADEARRLAALSLETFEGQADRRSQGVAHTWLAEIALRQGSFAEAEREARAAVELLAVAPPLRPLAYAALVPALLARQAVDEALQAAREGMAVIEERGCAEEGEEGLRVAFVEALLAAGHGEEADEALRAALARLEERAARIVDPELRQSFRERVPACRRTRALAAERLG